MPAPKRNGDQREHDLAKTGEMYLQGMSQAEIARQIGVTQQQISYDLRTLRQQWADAQLYSIDEAKAKELQKLDAVESEAWLAWHKSVGPKVKTITEDATTEKGTSSRKRKEIYEEVGDPRYLKVITSCIEQRRAIIGMDSPTKHEHSGPGGGAIPIEQATDDELRVINRLIDRWREGEN